MIGLAVFGFVYWFMDGIVDELTALGIHTTCDTYTLMTYFWTSILIVYLIFGGWWLVRKYDEWQYQRGRV